MDRIERTATTFLEELIDQGTEALPRITEYVIRDMKELVHWDCYRKSPWRGADDFDALFNEVFLGQLNKMEFYRKWLDHHKANKGSKLRRFIWVRILWGLHDEYSRWRGRVRMMGEGAEEALAIRRPEDFLTPEERLRKALASVIADRAARETREALEAEGLGDHWKIFWAAEVEGQRYRAIGQSFDPQIPEAKARKMAETARNRYRDTFRSILLDHGVPPREIDQEIRDIIDDMER